MTSVGNTGPLIIGRSGASGEYFLGRVDDVRIWSVVRTAAEISANFQSELSGAPAGLVGNWRFDEGLGLTAVDSAGTPQNATLQGGAAWSPDVP
jgi:Concanavalin A-like lectin/glucanases superfamily